MQAAPLLDALLFKTFKQAFGGRVRFIVSGGAPLATHVEQFLTVTLCAPVFQVRRRKRFEPRMQTSLIASHSKRAHHD